MCPLLIGIYVTSAFGYFSHHYRLDHFGLKNVRDSKSVSRRLIITHKMVLPTLLVKLNLFNLPKEKMLLGNAQLLEQYFSEILINSSTA